MLSRRYSAISAGRCQTEIVRLSISTGDNVPRRPRAMAIEVARFDSGGISTARTSASIPKRVNDFRCSGALERMPMSRYNRHTVTTPMNMTMRTLSAMPINTTTPAYAASASRLARSLQ